ncbi:MAG: DMT family transporter [Spirochaetales bacterium]|nr:DMT family transporter [Spirochaetales bacterium]
MNKNKQAVVYALSAILLWSTVATAFKKSLELVSAFDLLLLSCLCSVVALGGVIFFKDLSFRALKISREEGLSCFTGALLNPVSYYLVLFYSYDLLPAQIAQPLNYTWPLMLVLLSMPLLKKKPAPVDGAALLICFAGIVLISSGGRSGDLGDLSRPGIFLALFSSILWALYWLMGKRYKGRQEVRLFWNFLLALPVLLVIKPFLSPGFPDLSLKIVLWTGWVGFFEMGITFVFWGLALQKASHPAVISHLVYLSPFLSLFWISLILRESIQMSTVAGLGVIIFGILFREFLSGRGKSA